MDDFWRLRLRRDAYRPPDPGPSVGSCPTFLGKVISTGTNLGVGKFFKVNPVDASGTETESAAGTLTADASASVLVYALGPTAPAAGDYVVCRRVNHRWVADKQTVGSGGSTVLVGGCCGTPSVAIPTVLHLTATNAVLPTGAVPGSATFVDATLTFRNSVAPPDDPTVCPMVAGGCTQLWWSPLMEAGKSLAGYCPAGTGDTCLGYHYVLSCGSSIGLRIVLRQSCVSLSCSDHQNEASNQSWSTFASGNSCSPFLMTNPNFAHAGSAYLGSADITISG